MIKVGEWQIKDGGIRVKRERRIANKGVGGRGVKDGGGRRGEGRE